MTCRNESVPSGITSTPKSVNTDERCSDRVLCTPIKYTDHVPITPMPKYDCLDTPELHRLAKKFGMKQALGKTRLQTKLKEVYLYNHQLSSPAPETPTKGINYRLPVPQVDTILDRSEVDNSLCSPIESPKTTNVGFGNKLMHRVMKHHPKIIDLTNYEDARRTSKVEFLGVPECQPRLCSMTDRSHDADMTMKNAYGSVVEDSCKYISKNDQFQLGEVECFTNFIPGAITQSCGRVSPMPTISLLDSSTDSFVGNPSLVHDDKASVSGPVGKTGSKDFGFSYNKEECAFKIQSPNRSHEFIDLTASDLSHNSMEHSTSDIFEVRISRASEGMSCDHVDNRDCKNMPEKRTSKQDVGAFSSNDKVNVSSGMTKCMMVLINAC